MMVRMRSVRPSLAVPPAPLPRHNIGLRNNKPPRRRPMTLRFKSSTRFGESKRTAGSNPSSTSWPKTTERASPLEDFIHQWDPARLTINDWVSTQTKGKITDLLPSQSIGTNTRMVLVNAIHLKFPWDSPFQVTSTKNQSFTKVDGTSVSAPFMNQTGPFNYVDDGQAQIVGMPIAGGQLSVVIALPHGDLATYEAGLSANSAAIAQPPHVTSVALSLPKVDFTSGSVSLATPLKAMGMVDAFDRDNADFTGLSSSPPPGSRLYVSDVLQKTEMALQENGVEASAATAVVVGLTDGAAGGVQVVVNRPFLVSIVDVPTGALLFLGHIEDPTE